LSNCFLNSLNSLLIYLPTYLDYMHLYFVNFLRLTTYNIHECDRSDAQQNCK